MKARVAVALGLVFIVVLGAALVTRPKSLRQQFRDAGYPLARVPDAVGFSDYSYVIPGATRSEVESILTKAGFVSDVPVSDTEYRATNPNKQVSIFYYRGDQIVLLTATPELEISTYPELR